MGEKTTSNTKLEKLLMDKAEGLSAGARHKCARLSKCMGLVFCDSCLYGSPENHEERTRDNAQTTYQM